MDKRRHHRIEGDKAKAELKKVLSKLDEWATKLCKGKHSELHIHI